MEERKKLLQKFLQDYFDLKYFKVHYVEDFLVSLKDSNEQEICLLAVDNDTIHSLVNGTKYLTYKLSRDLENKEYFRVLER